MYDNFVIEICIYKIKVFLWNRVFNFTKNINHETVFFPFSYFIFCVDFDSAIAKRNVVVIKRLIQLKCACSIIRRGEFLVPSLRESRMQLSNTIFFARESLFYTIWFT